MARLAVRTLSLIAAYALVLHALLFALIPAKGFAGTVVTTVTCLAVGGLDQPAGPDATPCAPGCMMHGCSGAGWTPPLVAVIAMVTSKTVSILLQWPQPTLGPLSYKSPQAPRAPPVA